MVTIYGLVCPFTGEIRYIGKTANAPHKRLIAHLTSARRSKKTSHKQRWIAKCLADGKNPTLWILEEITEGVRWQDRERAWIAKAYAIGLELTNQTAGGEGLDWVDPEAEVAYRGRLSVSLKAVHRENPSLIATAQQGNMRSWRENREARIAAIVDAKSTPENKERHAVAMAKVRTSDSYKSAKSEGSKRAWQNHRDKLMTAFAQPEVKAKQSESKKRAWSDPETRERMMNRWTPEARAKQAAALAARSEKIQAAMTPEVRAKQAAKLKETWAKRKAAASG